YLPLFVSLCGVMMVMMFSSALDIIAEHPDIQVWVERFTARISRTMDSSDPFSGRTDIWEQTIQLWSERPLWGYAFEPFSNYSEYDTAHQQYLEILFKAG